MAEYRRLDEVCSLNMGQSPDSKSYNENGDGLPFFQGNADFGEMYPSVRMWCNSPTKVVEPGTLLISVRAPIGALNFATEKSCIGRGLAGIAAKDACDIKYIYYCLKGKNAELNAKGTGSTFKAIAKNALGETLVRIVPLDEQKQIVETLDRASSIIAARKQQLAALDTLIKARFVEMFGDVISNSKCWEKRRLDDVAASRLGKMLDAKQQKGTHPFPYLANFNVQWFRFVTDNLNVMDFNEADQEEFHLEYGDLLVCEGGEIGRCAVWHNELLPCYFQKALHRVRCNQRVILPDYLSWWFKFNCENGGFEKIAGAKATIAHLPGVKLKALSVAIPPIELQAQFSAFVAQVDKSKAAVQKVLDEAQLLFDSLMQKYFG